MRIDRRYAEWDGGVKHHSKKKKKFSRNIFGSARNCGLSMCKRKYSTLSGLRYQSCQITYIFVSAKIRYFSVRLRAFLFLKLHLIISFFFQFINQYNFSPRPKIDIKVDPESVFARTLSRVNRIGPSPCGV